MRPQATDSVHHDAGRAYTQIVLWNRNRVRSDGPCGSDLFTNDVPMSIAAGHNPSSFGPVSRWAVRLLAILALGISLYLAWHTLSGSAVAGCTGEGAGCDHVLASQWSHWLGLPVALGAVACYGMLFAASWFVSAGDERMRTVATRLLLLLAVVAGGAAIWFTGLQLVVIGEICKYCVAVHLIGVILAGIVLTAALTSHHRIHTSRHQMSSLRATLVPSVTTSRVAAPSSWSSRHAAELTIAGGCAILLVLMAGQVLFPGKSYVVETVALNSAVQFDPSASEEPQPEATEEPAGNEPKPEVHVAQRIPTEVTEDDAVVQAAAESPVETSTDETETASGGDESPAPVPERTNREISLLDGKLKFKIYQHAVIGSREAPYVVVEMMDYTCPHCRKMGRLMHEVLPRFGDQVAIVIMPVPLDAQCNKHMPRTGPEHRNACKYAQLAQAVMAIQPDKFGAMHHYLLADLSVPSLDPALTHAYELVKSDRLRETMNNEEISQRTQQYIELYVRLKKEQEKFGLPVQILKDEVVVGPIGTPTELETLWVEKLGVRPIE